MPGRATEEVIEGGRRQGRRHTAWGGAKKQRRQVRGERQEVDQMGRGQGERRVGQVGEETKDKEERKVTADYNSPTCRPWDPHLPAPLPVLFLPLG